MFFVFALAYANLRDVYENDRAVEKVFQHLPVIKVPSLVKISSTYKICMSSKKTYVIHPM